MWVLEPDLGPLQKQVLLSTEPSLKPLQLYFSELASLEHFVMAMGKRTNEEM